MGKLPLQTNKQIETMEDEICTCCNQIIDTVFHKEYSQDGGWDFEHDGFEDDTNVPPVFLGKFVDSKGRRWDLGFQMTNYRKAKYKVDVIKTTAVLVYSNEAPCYMSPSFRGLDDAREQIERLKKGGTWYAQALEEMVNRALAKGVEFPNPNY